LSTPTKESAHSSASRPKYQEWSKTQLNQIIKNEVGHGHMSVANRWFENWSLSFGLVGS